jgi:hypothetical protein
MGDSDNAQDKTFPNLFEIIDLKSELVEKKQLLIESVSTCLLTLSINIIVFFCVRRIWQEVPIYLFVIPTIVATSFLFKPLLRVYSVQRRLSSFLLLQDVTKVKPTGRSIYRDKIKY